MKLVEILARELKEWPSQVAILDQGAMGEVMDFKGNSRVFLVAERASDFGNVVTRAQWEAERARIYRETPFPNLDADAEAIVDDRCESKKQARSKEDQALWDDIAKAHFKKVCTEEYSRFQFFAEIAFDAADEFMAERAKRMK